MAAWSPTFRTATIDRGTLSTRSARDVLREACEEGCVSADATDTALLLTSELVTNAVTHGSGHPVLEIEVEQRRLRVTVTDDCNRRLESQRPDPTMTGSLLLLDALAARWGTDRRVPSGRSVWFELDQS